MRIDKSYGKSGFGHFIMASGGLMGVMASGGLKGVMASER